MSKQVELDRACNDCWAQGAAHERERIIQLLDSLNKHAHYKADFIIRLINKDRQTQ